MREAVIVSTARTGIGKAVRGYFNATEALTIYAKQRDAIYEDLWQKGAQVFCATPSTT